MITFIKVFFKSLFIKINYARKLNSKDKEIAEKDREIYNLKLSLSENDNILDRLQQSFEYNFNESKSKYMKEKDLATTNIENLFKDILYLKNKTIDQMNKEKVNNLNLYYDLKERKLLIENIIPKIREKIILIQNIDLKKIQHLEDLCDDLEHCVSKIEEIEEPAKKKLEQF